MKKNLGLITAFLLIIGLLYSRSFFLQGSSPDTDLTIKNIEQTTQIDSAGGALELRQPSDSTVLTFPPKSEPLSE